MHYVNEGPHNYKKAKMCVCVSHCVSELTQCLCTVTQQGLSCLLEACHPLVIPEVS